MQGTVHHDVRAQHVGVSREAVGKNLESPIDYRPSECTGGGDEGEAESVVVMYVSVQKWRGKRARTPLYFPVMSEEFLANRLLAVLSPEERARLLRGVKAEPFDAYQVLYTAGREITHVYFPLSGVISLVVMMKDANEVEATTIGNEGFIGVPLLLGVASTPMQVVGQIRGRALKIPARVALDEFRRGAGLNRLLLCYADAIMVQLAQHTACNRTHSIEQRCARWLLMAHDRVERDEFALTQEFLAQMLGVRRATVTMVAGALQKAGFIDYTRGHIRIVDRRGLEGVACECYEVVRRVINRVTA